MRDKILEQCDKDGDVLLIVGASHFKLAQLLKDAGVGHVDEYYITNSPVETNLHDISEGCIRLEDHSHIDYCGDDYHFDGMLIDLHQDPNQNATQLVGYHAIISDLFGQ